MAQNGNVIAVENDATPDAGVTEESVSKSIFSVLDKPQRAVSTGLHGFALRVDNFFFNEKVYQYSTGSLLRLRADMIWDRDSGDVGYDGDVRLKLNLPRTEKKLKLIIESDPIELQNETDLELQDSPLDVADESSYYAGLQRDSGDEKKWTYHTSFGIKARTPLDYFVRLRADRSYKLDKWLLRLDEGLFWFDSTGNGADTAVEFNRELSDDVLFRSRSYARWTEENNYYDLNQVFSVFESFGPRLLMAFQIGAYAVTEPIIFVTDYILAIRFRQDIHDNYLFFEFVPQVNYKKEDDFHPEHSIIFRLELVFND